MSKKVLLIAVLGLVAISFYFLLPKKLSNVKAKLHYMAYACGDCYPQYKIIEITSEVKGLSFLIDQDIDLKFNEDMKKEIQLIAEKCMICFEYKVEGTLVKDYQGKFEIIVESLSLSEKFDGCCAN